MALVAPLVIPFAEALGLSVGTLGMAKATDVVNKYIQENPEQSQKIITMIMPAQGIASMFEKRGIGDNNPPSPIEEEKPPQKEPPKEPNVGEEILTDLATRELDKKLSKEKNPDKKRAIEYLKETNEFYDKKNIKANEERPKLRNENLPKLVDADKHFGAAANSFEDFAESQLIYMSPQEYLDLTKRFRPEKQSELSKINSDNIKNLLKEGKELANYPYLYVKKDGENFSISGQEGIHRAIAFKNLGYDKMPVVIEGTGKDKVAGVENKLYTATPKSYLYTEDWAKDYIGFIPKSIQSDGEVLLTKPEDFYNVRTKEKLFERKEDFNLYKTVNKAQHNFLIDSLTDESNVSKSTVDKVKKLLYLNEKVTFTDKQLKELNDATADKRQLDYDRADKINFDDLDEDLNLSIKENAELLGTVTEQEYLNLFEKLKTSKKILKKAYGGFIDKPLLGRSRDI